MPALSTLDGSSVARVVSTYRDALRAHQEELNRLNVYPVPDGDTGTNMALTLESVCKELGTSTRMDDVCMAVPAISGGALFVRTQHALYSLGRK